MTKHAYFLLMQTDLSTFTDTSDSNIQFLAMLAGPFYPILQIMNEKYGVSLDLDIIRSMGEVITCIIF